MNKIHIFILINLLSLNIFAQQNLFNVISSDITPHRKVFYQHQMNIFSEETVNNVSFDFGLKHHCEIGFNIFNVTYQYKNNELVNNGNLRGSTPLFMINGQKGFKPYKFVDLSTGTQLGFDLLSTKKTFVNLLYFNSKFKFAEETIKIILGGYRFSYPQNLTDIAPWGGYEYKLFPEKLHLVGDWFFSKSKIGVGVLGVVGFPSKHISLSAGWQIPNSSTLPQGFVFEFTYIPIED